MRVLITGSAGFIGFHLSNLLLKSKFKVHGYDGMTSYYDINLKNSRNKILLKNKNYSFTHGLLEDYKKLNKIVGNFKPDIVVHLAAQAGVRYSIENPRSYIDSNIIGTFNLLEIVKNQEIKHLLIASTSSVYGANSIMPFSENDKADTQLTIYSASKKANESMAHSYSHLWGIPITIFRFFTVYGPWGRPDMALFKFVNSIINDMPIDLYNRGEIYRDFTYIDDLVYSIKLLMDIIPKINPDNESELDSLSPVAPFRIVNIGNSEKVKLLDFIEAIEEVLEKKAVCNYLPMQKGDVLATLSNSRLLKTLTDYTPKVKFNDGIRNFVDWYKEYYKI